MSVADAESSGNTREVPVSDRVVQRHTNTLKEGDLFLEKPYEGKIFKRHVRFYDVNLFTIEFDDGDVACNVHAALKWTVIPGGDPQ